MEIVAESDVVVVGRYENERVAHEGVAAELRKDFLDKELKPVLCSGGRCGRLESMEGLRQLDDHSANSGRLCGNRVLHSDLAGEVGSATGEKCRGFRERHAAKDEVLPVVGRVAVESPEADAA